MTTTNTEFTDLPPDVVKMMKIRKQQDLSQAEVAREIGVTSSAVSLWENGVTKPRGLPRAALRSFVRTNECQRQ